MSRDFTPFERYISNKQSGNDLWLQNIKWIDEKTGETKSFFTEEEQTIRKRFRFLAITMGDSFLKLYYQLPEEKRESRLYVLENMIQALQTACEKGNKAFEEINIPETVKKWYVGELDPDFYYSDENDRLFYEWCMGEKLA